MSNKAFWYVCKSDEDYQLVASTSSCDSSLLLNSFEEVIGPFRYKETALIKLGGLKNGKTNAL